MQEKDSKKFPGEIRRDPHNKVVTLSEEQEKWFRECYPYAPCMWIAKEMGVSQPWVSTRGHTLGLQKAYGRHELFKKWYGEKHYKNTRKLSAKKHSETFQKKESRPNPFKEK